MEFQLIMCLIIVKDKIKTRLISEERLKISPVNTAYFEIEKKICFIFIRPAQENKSPGKYLGEILNVFFRYLYAKEMRWSS